MAANSKINTSELFMQFNGSNRPVEGVTEPKEHLVENEFGGLTFQTSMVLRNEPSFSSSKIGTILSGEMIAPEDLTGETHKDANNDNLWIQFKRESKFFWVLKTEYEKNPNTFVSLKMPSSKLSGFLSILGEIPEELRGAVMMGLMKDMQQDKTCSNPIGTTIEGEVEKEE